MYGYIWCICNMECIMTNLNKNSKFDQTRLMMCLLRTQHFLCGGISLFIVWVWRLISAEFHESRIKKSKKEVQSIQRCILLFIFVCQNSFHTSILIKRCREDLVDGNIDFSFLQFYLNFQMPRINWTCIHSCIMIWSIYYTVLTITIKDKAISNA